MKNFENILCFSSFEKYIYFLWFVLRFNESPNDTSFKVRIFASTLCVRPALVSAPLFSGLPVIAVGVPLGKDMSVYKGSTDR